VSVYPKAEEDGMGNLMRYGLGAAVPAVVPKVYAAATNAETVIITVVAVIVIWFVDGFFTADDG
jgi:hypothetical protein